MKKLYFLILTLIFLSILYIPIIHAIEASKTSSREVVAKDNYHHGYKKIKQLKKIRDIIRKDMPDLEEKINTLKETNPKIIKRFFKQLQNIKVRHILRNIKRSNDEDTKILIKSYFTKELDSLILAEKHKNSKDDNENNKLETDIVVLLNEIFDIKLKLQTKMVEHFEKKIASLKNMLAKRQEFRQKIINDRLEDILTDPEISEW